MSTLTASDGVAGSDAISRELIRNALVAIAEEIAITHVRASYSSVVRDMLDFSTAVCDGEGRVLAQGLTLALQLGAIPRFMRHVLAGERPRRGDVLLLNHPWEGGVHLPDFFFATPVYLADEEEPLAYVVIVSHMIDVGGRFPGSVSAAARSLWEEGLVLPRVTLVEDGRVNQAVVDIVAANSREPAKVRGDLSAVMAGLEVGREQVLDLAGQWGPQRLRANMSGLLRATEEATREAIGQLPDGEATAVDYIDDDGASGGSARFECTVRKAGTSLEFDFGGTEEQLESGINTTTADVTSVVAFATRAALDADIEVNQGFYDCIDFKVPAGTLVSAEYPAAVSARGASIYRLTDVALAALGNLTPGRLPAGDGGPAVLIFSGRREDGSEWILLDYVQSGWGATSDGDGVPGVSHPISNAANIPVEVIEQECPLLVREYGLLPETAGRGRFVGAPSVVRTFRALRDDTTVTFRVDRFLHPPEGSAGGGSGSVSHCRVYQDGDWRDVGGKGSLRLDAGDEISVRLAAGGGFGDPRRRSPEDRSADVQRGLAEAL